MKRTTFLLAGLITLMATPALAHTGGVHANSVLSGLLHPFLGIDHMLAMLAVGLLAFQKGGKSIIVLPALFLASMVIGNTLGMSAISLPFVELGISGSIIILGAVIVAGHRIPVASVGLLIAGFAVFHGVAHGTEMPVNASTITYTLGFIAGTSTLLVSGISVSRLFSQFVSENVQSRLYRIAGATLAIAGIGLATT